MPVAKTIDVESACCSKASNVSIPRHSLKVSTNMAGAGMGDTV
jgi:hypothetical protein